MLLFTSGFSTLASLFKLIGLLILFVVLLVMASWFTKWYGSTAMQRQKHGNIAIIDGAPLGQGKMIQILRIGEHYVAIAVTKDQVTLLAELSEEELVTELPANETKRSFQDVYTALIEKAKK